MQSEHGRKCVMQYQTVGASLPRRKAISEGVNGQTVRRIQEGAHVVKTGQYAAQRDGITGAKSSDDAKGWQHAEARCRFEHILLIARACINVVISQRLRYRQVPALLSPGPGNT